MSERTQQFFSTYPKCLVIVHTEDANVGNALLNVTHASFYFYYACQVLVYSSYQAIVT